MVPLEYGITFLESCLMINFTNKEDWKRIEGGAVSIVLLDIMTIAKDNYLILLRLRSLSDWLPTIYRCFDNYSRGIFY